MTLEEELSDKLSKYHPARYPSKQCRHFDDKMFPPTNLQLCSKCYAKTCSKIIKKRLVEGLISPNSTTRALAERLATPTKSAIKTFIAAFRHN